MNNCCKDKHEDNCCQGKKEKNHTCCRKNKEMIAEEDITPINNEAKLGA